MNKIETNFLLYPEYEKVRNFVFNEYPLKDIHVGTTKNIESYSAIDRTFPQYYLFEYVLNGSGILKIADKTIPFSSGSTIFIRKGTTFSLIADHATKLNKIWLVFSSNYIENMLIEYSITSGVYNADNADNFNTFNQLFKIDYDYNVAYIFSENIHQILIKIASYSRFNSESLAFNIKRSLDSRLYDTCDIVKIAKELNISKSTLIRIFKKNYNLTPYNYLLNKKIEIAKNLLVSSKLSIKSISYTLSYNDERYFSYLFTNKVGISPNEYRKKFTIR